MKYFIAAINATGGSSWLAVTLIIMGIFVPIFLVICLVPYFCPKSKVGRWFAACSCCGPDPDFELLDDEDSSISSSKKRNSKDNELEDADGETTSISEEDETNSR
jgi:hypothetical protein